MGIKEQIVSGLAAGLIIFFIIALAMMKTF